MAETIKSLIERRGKTALRQSLAKVLQQNKTYMGVSATLDEWHRLGWGPMLFGGFLRDLMTFGINQWPRDIDIVLKNRSVDELKDDLSPVHPTQNRFGGFHCELNRWQCDIWPLANTWGFQKRTDLEPSCENLPKTTFLNVEAVAAELGDGGTIKEIYHHGFFEALQERIVDINFEENPYPPLAAVRALVTARKLDFAVSRKLSLYILDVADRHGLHAMTDAQWSHYGEVRLRDVELQEILQNMKIEIRSGRLIRISGRIPKQMNLWG